MFKSWDEPIVILVVILAGILAVILIGIPADDCDEANDYAQSATARSMSRV